jgi:hypothetical protein
MRKYTTDAPTLKEAEWLAYMQAKSTLGAMDRHSDRSKDVVTVSAAANAKSFDLPRARPKDPARIASRASEEMAEYDDITRTRRQYMCRR